MTTIKSFIDLEIWQLARTLHQEVVELVGTGTLKKDFELKDQMYRSSGSIMDNIAEGFGRGSRLEFIQFLSVSKGSANELQSQFLRCLDRKHIDEVKSQYLNDFVIKIMNKTGAFIKYLNETEIKGNKFQNRMTNTSTDNTKITAQNSQQQTPNNKQQTTNSLIKTSNAAKPLGAYPHARQVGNLLFLSGIGSRRAEDNKIPGLELDAKGEKISYDIEAECHQVFANVKAVLEASGSSWEKIVDVTVFLTNMKDDFGTYNKVYGEYFKDVQACRTTVEVKSLPTPIAIELKVIATL